MQTLKGQEYSPRRHQLSRSKVSQTALFPISRMNGRPWLTAYKNQSLIAEPIINHLADRMIRLCPNNLKLPNLLKNNLQLFRNSNQMYIRNQKIKLRLNQHLSRIKSRWPQSDKLINLLWVQEMEWCILIWLVGESHWSLLSKWRRLALKLKQRCAIAVLLCKRALIEGPWQALSLKRMIRKSNQIALWEDRWAREWYLLHFTKKSFRSLLKNLLLSHLSILS